MSLNPEQVARQKIDSILQKSGWVVQDYKSINFSAGDGVAVREYPTNSGPADYMLFVNKKPLGVIEAKREDEGHRITKVETQSNRYASSELKHFGEVETPFIYESIGEITRYTDRRDPKPKAREVFAFHHPETLLKRLEQRSLRDRLNDLPELNSGRLRECQINAIQNLDQSFKEARPKALVQMATGSGKTFTAITTIYRLLKHAKAKRVLFLVDTKNRGEQAEQEFMQFMPADDNRTFTEIYTTQRLTSSYMTGNNQVYISTIQRLYSMMKGEEIDDSLDEQNPNERFLPIEPLPVIYNPMIPIEFFDVIVIDECHRSIYNLWKQVLDYFDSFLIGLTATPDKRTFAFLNENVVSEYSHEKAVADGVNVGFDVYTIEIKISKDGAKIEAKEFAEGNEFSKKVTYKIEEDPKSILAQFRNEYYSIIAVTVDMIATGTAVRPLECLLFMRDVKMVKEVFQSG